MADIANTAAVIRELRRGPVAIADIVERAGLSQQVVYRIVGQLEAAGAPLVRGELAHQGGGRPAATLRITRAGLLGWLG